MFWLILPLALLTFGLVGLVLSVRSYRKGESISSKKIVTMGMFFLLGIAVLLQGMGVIDIPQLRQILLAFATD